MIGDEQVPSIIIILQVVCIDKRPSLAIVECVKIMFYHNAASVGVFLCHLDWQCSR